MSEYIDKDYVTKCLMESWANSGIPSDAKNKMLKWLNKAPTAADVQPVRRWRWEWIPVTELSPDIGDSVIVSGKMKHQWEKEYERFVDVAIYNEEGAFETFIDWYEGQQQFEVTHWMPLPEPPEESVGWYENNKEEYKNV